MTRPDARHEEPESHGRVRIDKWLWAARFFKTRSLAADAVGAGKVLVGGERAKAAKLLQVGDELRIRLGAYEHVVRVRALSERRGPAAVAATLYEETADSVAARARLAEQHRMAPAAFVYEEKGRPTKRDRRELDRFRDDRRGR
ncbi:MAG TPA: RNA-binding S4 domain-containing protein [Gemmatimonadaceae bacterium]|jgi:ribosome-associated heat shock protein Hsp15|nr:RNA-binding S4 domain-containing protein [Gemmatimonadaceae bacterium]